MDFIFGEIQAELGYLEDGGISQLVSIPQLPNGDFPKFLWVQTNSAAPLQFRFGRAGLPATSMFYLNRDGHMILNVCGQDTIGWVGIVGQDVILTPLENGGGIMGV